MDNEAKEQNELVDDRAVNIQEAAYYAREEALRACREWERFNSAHEGYAVLLEELDELWAECKKRVPNKVMMGKEAIQVAAMAIRFAAELAE
jgi:hypothetical protein